MKTMRTALALLAAALCLSPTPARADSSLATTEVSFKGSGGLTLRGTVLAPRTAAKKPGVVLIHGAGSGLPRTRLLTEATEFARRGLAVLIYDKRSAGYTLTSRSYSALADDALGAARVLRSQPGVDPAKVGLWGFSEGGWVAPLAASRSPEAAFVITVGGNAMTPLRQEIWAQSSALRRAGVSGPLVDHAQPRFSRLLGDVDLFPEAHHDPQPVLRKVRQPFLGVWGAQDVLTPPQENPPLFARGLRSGGNTHYTFRYFPNAEHAAHRTTDNGVTHTADLAPGYADLVATWVKDVTDGRLPNADAPTPPKQPSLTSPAPPLAWWESPTAQAAAALLFLAAFTAYPLTALARKIRGRSVPTNHWAKLLTATASTASLGGFLYLGYLMGARGASAGPTFAGRPLPWLALQLLAFLAAIALVGTAVTWHENKPKTPKSEHLRLGLLLTAGAVFIPWSLYWGLLRL